MKFIILCLISSLLFFSCKNDPFIIDDEGNVTILQEKTNGDTLKLSYAKCFRIIKYKDAAKIEILDSEQDFKVAFTYDIGYQNTSFLTPSTDESRIILSPVNKTIALSSTHIGMLKTLSLTDKIVGVSSKDYLCSEKVLTKVEAKEIKEVQDIDFANFENYLTVNPDLIIYSGFNNSAPILDKLKEANIVTFANYDWKEIHPLGRAEWIKVFGLLYGKEDEAKSIFDLEVLKYNQLKDKVANLINNKTVLSGSVWGDFWNAPAGESYMAQIFKDANINYVYANTKGAGSLNLQFEEVVAQYQHADFWFNVTGSSLKEVENSNAKYTLFDAFKNQNIYTYTANGNCFWEETAVAPHKILSDFITIFHPTALGNNSLYYYQKLK